MVKKSVKFILVILLLVLLFLAAIPLFLQTRPFKNWLASFVEKTVSKSLNAEISIGRIDGNFFTKLHLSDLVVASDQDTIAAISALSLSYTPRHLLHKKIVFSSIVIDTSFAHIIQHEDSSWIFRPRIVEPEQTVMPVQRDSSPFAWTIQVDTFKLTNLNATITALDSLIPRRIANLALELAGLYSASQKRLNLASLSFSTTSPDFRLQQLAFLLEQDTTGIRLENVQLRTGHNRIFADASMEADTLRNAVATLSTEPIDFSEFQFMLPGLAIKGQPTLQLDSRLKDNRLKTSLSVESRQSDLYLEADITNFSSLLGDSTKNEPTYQIKSSFHNVSLSNWTPQLGSGIVLNGHMDINGKGITATSADASVVMNYINCEIKDRKIDTLFVRARYHKGRAQAQLNLVSPAGDVQVDAAARSLLDTPRYEATVSAKKLDLASALLDTNMTSNLNFDLSLNGTSFALNELEGAAELFMHPSRIYGVDLDSLHINATMAAQSFDLVSFYAKSNIAQAKASGRIGLQSSSDVNIDLTSDNLAYLNTLINADTLAGRVNLSAHVTGDLDSLFLSTRLNADSLRFNTFAIETLSATADIEKRKDDFFGAAIANVHSIDLGKILIQDIGLQTEISPEKIDLHAELTQNEDIRARIYGQYWLYELPIIYLKQLDVDVFDNHWRGGSDSTSIVFNKDEYIVTNLRIQNIIHDSVAAEIYADGCVRMDGPENFLLRIHNYNLAPLTHFVEKEQKMGGVLDLEIALSGTADRPELQVKTLLQDTQYDKILIKKIDGTIFYKDEKISTDVLVIPRTDSLILTGYIPAYFSLTEQKFDLHKSRPFDLSLQATDVPIQNIGLLKQWVDEYRGYLNINIHATNSLSDVTPRGYIALENCHVRNEQLGFSMDDVNMKINIQPDSIVLQRFSARQNKGSLDITGFAALDSSIFSGILDAIQIKVSANDFYLSQKPEHEIQIDSDIFIQGTPDSLNFGGSLEVLRASIYLPAFTSRKNTTENPQTPLLVEAISAAETDTSRLDSTIFVEVKKAPPPVMKNLRGTLKVKMPRNIWIKNDNFRAEIGGNIDIIKNAEFFELFGTINILRGQYDFLARRFKLTEGTISFQGGEKINPMLNVTAGYTFRDANRDKKTVYLLVNDKALNPEITFKLDDNNITEGEAVSYILFNRSPDQVGAQNGQGPSQTGYLATDLVYGMMSAELSRRFGQQLGVDYIEIKGQDNLNTATFVVGKYITPDLFMSYEHSIGTLEEDHAPQVVTVEYQLTKYIFLQLVSGDTKTTGADIILKFDMD
ncbi:translocation/assembly module TamB [candidate division KSB1 bacterium]|nr:translocation/assembly module TamB domain-containing protein [candidate division KSB1 bacterium]RQW05679.1 MAG: translocation/assembly module TamB [candidate division KSB1 bacterium]